MKPDEYSEHLIDLARRFNSSKKESVFCAKDIDDAWNSIRDRVNYQMGFGVDRRTLDVTETVFKSFFAFDNDARQD